MSTVTKTSLLEHIQCRVKIWSQLVSAKGRVRFIGICYVGQCGNTKAAQLVTDKGKHILYMYESEGGDIVLSCTGKTDIFVASELAVEAFRRYLNGTSEDLEHLMRVLVDHGGLDALV